MLAVALFLLAGPAFVILTFMAAIGSTVAPGIDAPNPVERVEFLRVVAWTTWSVGAVAVVGGLVMWIVSWVRGRSGLGWAVSDVLVMLLALGAVAFL